LLTFAVLKNTLKFAECRSAQDYPPYNFNVKINGSLVLTSFDPVVAAGGVNRALDLSFSTTVDDGKVVYFRGLLPVFQHDAKDLKSFRMYTSQLIANGMVRQ
jgi:hypothetical protein